MKVPCFERTHYVSQQQSVVLIVTVFVLVIFPTSVVPRPLQRNAFPRHFQHVLLVIFFLLVQGIVLLFRFFHGEGFHRRIGFLGCDGLGGGVLFGCLFRFLLASGRVRTGTRLAASGTAPPLLDRLGRGNGEHRNVLARLGDRFPPPFPIVFVRLVVFHVPFPLLGGLPGQSGTLEPLVPAGNGLLQDGGQESIRRGRHDRCDRVVQISHSLALQHAPRECRGHRRSVAGRHQVRVMVMVMVMMMMMMVVVVVM
mmetsp:Transcript_5142/g.12628  ORF Transcript_5142/g.12628 Transcript_5142/m.12628 type:complete len:254 (-) Transcript_5142:904-1665(-)